MLLRIGNPAPLIRNWLIEWRTTSSLQKDVFWSSVHLRLPTCRRSGLSFKQFSRVIQSSILLLWLHRMTWKAWGTSLQNPRRFAFHPHLGRLIVPKSEPLNHLSTVVILCMCCIVEHREKLINSLQIWWLVFGKILGLNVSHSFVWIYRFHNFLYKTTMGQNKIARQSRLDSKNKIFLESGERW